MTDRTQDLLSRVEALETQNRRLRRVGGGLLAGLGLVGLLSMAAPPVCKTVWGERFVLKDSSNRDRMVLNAYSTDTPSLTLNDERGTGMARLVLADEGMQLQFLSKGKPTGATFHLTPDTLGTRGDGGSRKADKKEDVGSPTTE